MQVNNFSLQSFHFLNCMCVVYYMTKLLCDNITVILSKVLVLSDDESHDSNLKFGIYFIVIDIKDLILELVVTNCDIIYTGIKTFELNKRHVASINNSNSTRNTIPAPPMISCLQR